MDEGEAVFIAFINEATQPNLRITAKTSKVAHMLSFLNLSAFLTSFYVVSRYFSLQRNIRKAVKTNLPYIVVPVYTATPLWYFCYSFILPVFQKLPTAWTDSWLA